MDLASSTFNTTNFLGFLDIVLLYILFFIPFGPSFVYYPCTRVVPLWNFLMKLFLIKKKKKQVQKALL